MNEADFSVDSAYLLIFWQSILNMKSTRTPEQIEQLSFEAIGAKFSL